MIFYAFSSIRINIYFMFAIPLKTDEGGKGCSACRRTSVAATRHMSPKEGLLTTLLCNESIVGCIAYVLLRGEMFKHFPLAVQLANRIASCNYTWL